MIATWKIDEGKQMTSATGRGGMSRSDACVWAEPLHLAQKNSHATPVVTAAGNKTMPLEVAGPAHHHDRIMSRYFNELVFQHSSLVNQKREIGIIQNELDQAPPTSKMHQPISKTPSAPRSNNDRRLCGRTTQ
jgi:hypothetical protein